MEFELIKCSSEDSLEKPFASDTGETSVQSLFRSPGRYILGQYHNVVWMVVLKRLFISDTGEASARSLFRCSRRQTICWETRGLQGGRAVMYSCCHNVITFACCNILTLK